MTEVKVDMDTDIEVKFKLTDGTFRILKVSLSSLSKELYEYEWKPFAYVRIEGQMHFETINTKIL